MTDWYSFDTSKTNKPFNCAECKREVATNEKRWWNAKTKAAICIECYNKQSAQSSGTPASTTKQGGTPEIPQSKCDVCGDMMSTTTKESHHVLRGGKWWHVCFYCFNTIRRVRAIKVAGLWPFEKKKDVGEQYDLTPTSATLSTGSPLVSPKDEEV